MATLQALWNMWQAVSHSWRWKRGASQLVHIERLSGSTRHALTALRPSTNHSLPPWGIPMGYQLEGRHRHHHYHFACKLSTLWQLFVVICYCCYCCCCSSCFIRFWVFILFCFFLSEVVLLIYDFFKWNYVYPSTGNAISCFFSSLSLSISLSLPHFFFW